MGYLFLQGDEFEYYQPDYTYAILRLLLGIIFDIIIIIFIYNNTQKRGIPKSWSLLGLLGVIGWLIYLIARKPKIDTKNTQNNSNIYNTTVTVEKTIETPKLIIPETCPKCHNPNTRHTRLCEWCV